MNKKMYTVYAVIIMKYGEVLFSLYKKYILRKVYILFIVVDDILKHLSVVVFMGKKIYTTKLSHFYYFCKNNYTATVACQWGYYIIIM